MLAQTDVSSFCAGLPALTLATWAPEATESLTDRVVTPSVGVLA